MQRAPGPAVERDAEAQQCRRAARRAASGPPAPRARARARSRATRARPAARTSSRPPAPRRRHRDRAVHARAVLGRAASLIAEEALPAKRRAERQRRRAPGVVRRRRASCVVGCVPGRCSSAWYIVVVTVPFALTVIRARHFRAVDGAVERVDAWRGERAGAAPFRARGGRGRADRDAAAGRLHAARGR